MHAKLLFNSKILITSEGFPLIAVALNVSGFFSPQPFCVPPSLPTVPSLCRIIVTCDQGDAFLWQKEARDL